MPEAIGGQAVIEGVMMRNGKKIAIAVRKGKKIILKKQVFNSITEKKPFSFPIIRGAVMLVETLIVGAKTLEWSAELAAGKKEEKISKWQFALSLVFATIFALLLFKLLPLGIAQLSSKISAFSGRIAYNLIEGLSKILIFVLYIYLIGRMKDVKRLFQYHGAEHKAVNCLEAGKPLTIQNAMKFTTIHPRCGTSFILFVLFISVLVYIFVPMNFGFWAKYGLRIALLPIIAGISYEFLKFGSKHTGNRFVKALLLPGMQLQKLTTNEPDKKMLEVSIKALKSVMK